MTDKSTTEKARETGERIGAGAGRLAGAVTAATLATTAKFIPMFRTALSKKLAYTGAKNYHKAAGGDALGLIAEPGQQLELTPIKYRPPEDCEEGERPGWTEKGRDKVWHAGAEGRVVDYLGDTPIVALERDSHVEAGWLKPRIGQAIELENYDPVFTNPQIEPEVVADLSPDADAGTALADGGPVIADVGVSDLGRYDSAEVVDLDSGDGYDGMRVDFRKASAWAFEQTTTEEMQMQEDRGFLRGQISAGNGPSMVKLLLICAAIILGALAIILLGPSLVGGSLPSAGGGGINPLSVLAGSLVG